MTVVRKISSRAESSSDSSPRSVAETGLVMMISGKCPSHHQRLGAADQQLAQQHGGGTRFKSVVRRVLFALAFRLRRRSVDLPPTAGHDDSLDGSDGCSAGLVVTSTSTVTTTVCRLTAVEEEQHSRCNSLVSVLVTQGVGLSIVAGLIPDRGIIKSPRSTQLSIPPG